MLAIARGISNSGRQVLFCTSERYLPLAERAGLRTHCLVSEKKFLEMTSDPHLWSPVRGLRVIFSDTIRDFLNEHYDFLESTCSPDKTILVNHMLDFASRIYKDRHPETRLVSVGLSPSLLRSHRAPPRYSGRAWEPWFPKILLPAALACADHWLDSLCGPHINQLRHRLGLKPVHQIVRNWWWSPDLVLLMFPEWFSVPHSDLKPQMEHLQFPLCDSGDLLDGQVPQEVASFLSRIPDKPIVFAPGTAHHHASKFLRAAKDASSRLNRSAILLSTDASQIPHPLPPNIMACKYVPFRQLLRSAGLIVHHGGVGTTSQALAAGIPQLVLPMAFDQFDNASRVQRLGCGRWFPMTKVSASKLVAAIQKLPQSTQHTGQVAERLRNSPLDMQYAVNRILMPGTD